MAALYLARIEDLGRKPWTPAEVMLAHGNSDRSRRYQAVVFWRGALELD
jgi:hypothetical protein